MQKGTTMKVKFSTMQNIENGLSVITYTSLAIALKNKSIKAGKVCAAFFLASITVFGATMILDKLDKLD